MQRVAIQISRPCGVCSGPDFSPSRHVSRPRACHGRDHYAPDGLLRAPRRRPSMSSSCWPTSPAVQFCRGDGIFIALSLMLTILTQMLHERSMPCRQTILIAYIDGHGYTPSATRGHPRTGWRRGAAAAAAAAAASSLLLLYRLKHLIDMLRRDRHAG